MQIEMQGGDACLCWKTGCYREAQPADCRLEGLDGDHKIELMAGKINFGNCGTEENNLTDMS